MSSCPHHEEVLKYRLDMLDEKARRLFEQHLGGCPICQYEMAVETNIEAELARELAPVLSEEQVLAQARMRAAVNHLSLPRHLLEAAAYAAAAVPVLWFIRFSLNRLSPAMIREIESGLSSLTTQVTSPIAIGLLVAIGIVLLTASTAFALSTDRA